MYGVPEIGFKYSKNNEELCFKNYWKIFKKYVLDTVC